MKTLRTTFSVLAVLAVATAPVAAALLPCCCNVHIEGVGACHEQSAADESHATFAAPKSCCAEHHLSQPKTVGEFVHRAGCCCLKAPPESTPAVPKLSSADLRPDWLVGGLELPARVDRRADAARSLAAAEHSTPSAVSLQALYCTWLK